MDRQTDGQIFDKTRVQVSHEFIDQIFINDSDRWQLIDIDRWL